MPLPQRYHRTSLRAPRLNTHGIPKVWHTCAVCHRNGPRRVNCLDAWHILSAKGWFIDREENILCPEHAPKRDEPIVSHSNLNWKPSNRQYAGSTT